MRLDHLLSKEMDSKGCYVVNLSGKDKKFAGGDALMGDTRTHPEHDG